MNTEHTLRIASTSLEDTWHIAEQIGCKLRGGEVIELISDLGGGKTAFVQGLAKGAGSTDRVSSPSFNLRNEYKTDKFTIYHFDFYRLNEPGIMQEELAETLADQQAVTVVEWADIVNNILPDSRVTITITATGESDRQFDVSYTMALDYLFGDKD